MCNLLYLAFLTLFSGNFGKVYQGKFEDSNKMKQDVAIKTLHNSE